MRAETYRKPDISPDDDKPLPLFDYASDELPTGRKAEVVAYGGDAEDAFMKKASSKNAIIQAEAIDELLTRMVKTLDGKRPSEKDVLDMHDADRRAVLLRGRWRTYPDSHRIAFKWRCAPPYMPEGQGCGDESNHHAFDIETVNIEPVVLPSPVTLPISKRVLTFDPPTGNTAIYYLKLRKGADAPDRTAQFMARGCQLDGKRATQAELRALIGGDRAVIARELSKAGGPNTQVESPCNGCNALWKTLAEALPGFFFPREEE